QFSDFSWAVRTDRFSLIYNPEDKKIGLYKLEDVRHENEISEQYPNVVSAMKNDLAEFANKSKRPISKDNYDKFDKVISEIN
ncbi:sulfatase, partial [Vibrio mimicus]